MNLSVVNLSLGQCSAHTIETMNTLGAKALGLLVAPAHNALPASSNEAASVGSCMVWRMSLQRCAVTLHLYCRNLPLLSDNRPINGLMNLDKIGDRPIGIGREISTCYRRLKKLAHCLDVDLSFFKSYLDCFVGACRRGNIQLLVLSSRSSIST